MAWGILNTHTGSWGTPELGVTEWLSKVFGGGGGTTTQGGSNLSAPWTAPAELAAQQNLATQLNTAYKQPTYTPTSSTNTGGTNTGGTNTTTPSQPSPDDLYRQWLDQQYGAQEGYINEMESGLSSQKSGLEQIAQNTYQQGANTLGTQYGTNKGDLESYQAKTLQDIGEALNNMWQQGGRMLGTRGASDSSAAGMYNYAVGKLGSKQRGDVMQDVSRRLTNLKTTYDTNLQNLELEKSNQIQQIGQWYADALNSIKGMRAELQQQKSEQALSVAIQMLNDARTRATSQQSILDQWAANKAQSLPQLKAMLASNAANLQPFQGLTANTQFSGTAQSPGLFGFGNIQSNDSLNWLQNLFSR